MTTYTTDTGKRLSDLELADIRQWAAHKDDMAVGPDFRTGMSFAAKLLSHIAAITAPPSQGKAERARFEAEAKRQMDAQARMEVYEAREKNLVWLEGYFDVEALVSQALTEPTQGTSVEAMREAAAKVALDMRGEDYSTMAGSAAVRLRNQIIAKEIRALPLPVSADGSANRDAVIEECAWRLEVDGFKHCAATLRALKSTKHEGKAKPVCDSYHALAIGVACSNCGHSKEAHHKHEGDGE